MSGAKLAAKDDIERYNPVVQSSLLAACMFETIALSAAPSSVGSSTGRLARNLRQFVSEIRYDGARLTMSGRKDALMAAALDEKRGHREGAHF